MKRFRYTAALLCAAMLAGTCMVTAAPVPAAVYAETVSTQQVLTYSVQNGEVTVTGFTADLPEVLEIPAEIGGMPVTRIGAYAFHDAAIKAVTIPEGVRVIENNAFCFCKSLETVSLPDSIEKIGSHAFSMTKWLNRHPYSDDGKFIIEKNILLLADECACKGEVIIPEGIRYIAGGAFFSCDAMTSAVIPDGVTGFGDGAFDGCFHLTSVSIPASVTEIGKYAFSGCRLLKAVSLPAALCSIGDAAFLGCDLLETVTFAEGTNGLTEIPFNAFRSCISLKSARLPDSVTSIGDFAFFYCIELTDFALPPALTHLGESALNDCYALESLTIPETITDIPECAFTFCENVPEITVPAGVTAVDAQAFWLCKKLERITFLNPACTIYDAADTISTERDGGFAGVIAGYEGSEAQAYAEKYGCTFASLGAAPAPLTGDLNNDGGVGTDDAQNTLRAYVRTVAYMPDGLSAYRRAAADVDGDAAITVSDAQYILMYYTEGLSGKQVGWETLLAQSRSSEG